MTEMQEWIDGMVAVVTNDGRIIVGALKGYDQTNNLILANSVERVFGEEGVEIIPLGLYIIRGDNVAALGNMDMELDRSIDWAGVHAQPLPSIRNAVY
ncbi:putative u6 snRNA-associated sm-like protein lsm8 [Powellomyces hirtus]|nr:putative u6 snRNA-associated sm-like protein lsm8 [Powellomyces hirtus]